jgi:hypothetical protein
MEAMVELVAEEAQELYIAKAVMRVMEVMVVMVEPGVEVVY